MATRLRKTLPRERLSPSEWEIMRICWRLGRCTVRDVLEEDLKTHKRDYRTILTFMTRMAEKGWLSKQKSGKKSIFTPIVPVQLAISAEIESFLARLVGPETEHLALVWQELRRLLAK